MSNLEMVEPPVNQGASPEEEARIDFLDVLGMLAQRRRSIAVVTLVALLVGIGISVILRPTFKSSALILPPQQQQSTASMLAGQLTALAGLTSGSASLLKNPADMYVGILESRTIADQLIRQFGLKSVYKTKRLVDTEAALKRHSTIEASKDGLIQIDVRDHDPNRASDLANGYIDALYRMNSNLAIGEAAQRRVFFDQQLNEEKANLKKAEEDLRDTERKTGVIQLSSQMATIIRGIADTQAEIDSSEVELKGMNTFATEQNPETIRLQQRIAALRNQLANLENSQQKLPLGAVEMPAGKIPQASLEYVDKYRELQYNETLYELLAKQYEAARLDEAKSVPIIQVIDRAIPPDRKNGPPRTLLSLGFAFAGFCLACLWVLFKNGLLRMQQDPEMAEKLRRLRESFR